MFTLSKLLLGGGALASSGGLSAYFIPKLTDSGENTIYKQGSSEDNINYEKLNIYSKTKLEELSGWVDKLTSSKSFAIKDKEEKHKKSLELMTQIATGEEALQKLYQHIEEKLKSLQKESQTLTETIQEKLKVDAQFQQIKVSQGALNQLVKQLKQWESQLSSVICAFKQQGEEKEEAQCDSKSQTLLSTVLSPSSSTGGGEGASPSANGESQTEGEKAKQVLAQAQKVFEQLQQSVSQANLSVQKESMKMIWEEISRYPEWVRLHSKIQLVESHIQLINRTIRTTNDEATKKTEEINRTNEELRVTYDKYNTLKRWESSFHSFIEQFQEKIRQLKRDSTRSNLLSEEG